MTITTTDCTALGRNARTLRVSTGRREFLSRVIRAQDSQRFNLLWFGAMPVHPTSTPLTMTMVVIVVVLVATAIRSNVVVGVV